MHSLVIPKGTIITISMTTVNRSEEFRGPDGKQFKPERWLTECSLDSAKEIQGHHHLLTFSDGPRTCLGKGFALAELKVIVTFSWHAVTHV
jgi:cytochrome P450